MLDLRTKGEEDVPERLVYFVSFFLFPEDRSRMGYKRKGVSRRMPRFILFLEGRCLIWQQRGASVPVNRRKENEDDGIPLDYPRWVPGMFCKG